MARWTRNRWIAVAGVAVIVAAGAGYAVFASLAGGGPAAVSLSPAAVVACTASPSAAEAATGSTSSLDGTWTVRTPGSFVGYRVREQLSILPAPSEAVGRTTAVSGTLTIAGLSITEVDVTADLTQLTSDRSQRDDRIRTEGLETDRFPKAEFVLTSPIAFASQPAQGATVTAGALGDLTVHGVTKAMCVPVQASWRRGSIEVLGSVPVTFSEFDVVAPSSGFVSVQDHGTFEFDLTFAPGD